MLIIFSFGWQNASQLSHASIPSRHSADTVQTQGALAAGASSQSVNGSNPKTDSRTKGHLHILDTGRG